MAPSSPQASTTTRQANLLELGDQGELPGTKRRRRQWRKTVGLERDDICAGSMHASRQYLLFWEFRDVAVREVRGTRALSFVATFSLPKLAGRRPADRRVGRNSGIDLDLHTSQREFRLS